MVLSCVGSSSAGNGYVLRADNGDALIIEAGFRVREYLPLIDYNILKVRACVVSHSHNDHAGHVADFANRGITVLALPDVFESKGVSDNIYARPICAMRGYRVGPFRVFAVPVLHDVPCLSFIIDHREMGRLFFITDTMMLEYKLPPINHYLIEANYSDDILIENIDSGCVSAAMKPRLLRSHMELNTTKGILNANDLSCTQDITLIHLSDGNSDDSRFKSEIEQLTGIPTYIAKRGFTLDITLK